ncbi:Nn.00g004900.m01.CDS01 [Neocucurbitaria sp. VM-36]
MLLTLSNPVKPGFEFKPHDYSPAFSTPTAARYSPKLNGGRSHSQTVNSSSTMGTPHRGLPPPSAMTLPDPGRGPPPIQSALGSLPPAPSQWQGAEDGMKNWLAAKAEEERRKQEEERTRQETLRLEQRKIEQSMLRESMQGGIPPHLVPIIFAGVGGGNLANISAEWIQQYTAQVQAAHQQAQAQTQSQLSPDVRRDARMIAPSQSTIYAGQPQTPQTILPPTSVLPGQPLPTQAQHAPLSATGYVGGPPLSPRARAAQSSGFNAPTSAPRGPPQSQLPRLTTNEMNIQQPPAAPSGVQQLQTTQTAQQEQSSPSIYFHHWVPPSSSSQQEKSTSGNPPATPSGKYKASPIYQPRQRAASHASDLEYTSSPKKRKAQGQHQPAPPPTSAPQSYTSPSFSHISTSSASTPGRRGHARARSDASNRGPEGSSGAVSRRGTISSFVQETTARQGDIPEEPRVADGKPLPNLDPAYATPPHRNDGRGQGPQNYAPTSAASQHETPKYGPQHQHWDTKREIGDR